MRANMQVEPLADLGDGATRSYGVSAYRRNQIETYLSRTADFERQDMDRRRRTTVLMDAYGDKSSLDDVQRAMALYESQQGDE
ncbi:hypothetical protein Daus18300_011147 [Diaporthe australafricana]|uniref:Uncharacterized protein n=1 Tax=Diaporthe australafricana TaxID=127596 RepID=A0ABR3W7T0_9PEZI